MNNGNGSLRTQTLARAFVLGFASGLRSIVAFSMLAFVRGRNECAVCAPAPLRLMRSEPGQALLGAATLGELVVDKLPIMPARTAPAPLLGRLGFGAATGLLATMATTPGRSASVAAFGALLGAAGAGVGAFAGQFARTKASCALDLPDAPVALVEDAVALSVASVAARA